MPDTITHPVAEAAPGHNSAAVGEMIDADPAVIFRDPDLVPALFSEIETSIDALTPDVSTEVGRKAIASLAYGIAKTKTRLDAAGKALNEDHRAAIGKVDAVRKTVRDRLDELRDQARAPLTEWETAEDAREKRIADTLSRLEYAARPAAGADSTELAHNIRAVEAVTIDEPTFRNRVAEVTMVRDRVLATLRAAHVNAVKAEEAQAELARIKAEQAEKDRVEAEARATAAAEAERQRLAEAERQREAAALKAAEDRAAADAKAKAEKEASAARERERKAAQAKIDAAEAERKAAADALAAKERADAEAKRKADAEAAEAKRRAADQAHRERIVANAVDALIRHTSLTDEQARSAVLAIAAGQVPALSITF